MKKLFILGLSLFCGAAAFAQTVTGGDMEVWRQYQSGGTTLAAPYGWKGSDSLVFALAPLANLIGDTVTPQKQVFQSNIIHGGTYSALLVTRNLGPTLGTIPGLITNGNINIDLTTLGYSVSGGLPVSARITHVLAWVKYTTPGVDSGTLEVEATKFINNKDSVIGTALVNIGPSASFTQVSAKINYVDPTLVPDTLRINFASSGITAAPVDSSMLYVDDVTVDTLTLAVASVSAQQHQVTCYPNPTTGNLYLHYDGNEKYNWQAYSVSGQAVAKQALTGNDVINLSSLANGMYFYDVTDNTGTVLQRGKVTVMK